MPALEWSGLLVGDPDGGANGFQTARAIVSRLQDRGVCAIVVSGTGCDFHSLGALSTSQSRDHNDDGVIGLINACIKLQQLQRRCRANNTMAVVGDSLPHLQ